MLTRLAVVPLLLGTATAQAVHVVGPGGFAQIRDAIPAAAPGDFVVIAPGTYGAFLLDRGLTLLALPGGAVQVVPDATRAITVCAIPAGQQAHLSRLQWLGSNQPITLATGHLQVTSGLVSLDSCAVVNVTTSAGLELLGGAVTAHACNLTGSPAATVTGGSALAASQTAFAGAPATSASPGGRGLMVINASTAHLAGCAVSGGAAGSSLFGGGDAANVAGGSSLRISDSTVIGGNGGQSLFSAPGNGLVNSSVGPVVHARTSFAGGSPSGSAIVGAVLADDLVGVQLLPASLALGAGNVVHGSAVPGSIVGVAATFSLAPPSLLAVMVEPTWLGSNVMLLGAGIANGSGDASVAVIVPNQVALRGVGVWFHVAAGTGLPLHVAPPVGGIVQ